MREAVVAASDSPDKAHAWLGKVSENDASETELRATRRGLALLMPRSFQVSPMSLREISLVKPTHIYDVVVQVPVECTPKAPTKVDALGKEGEEERKPKEKKSEARANEQQHEAQSLAEAKGLRRTLAPKHCEGHRDCQKQPSLSKAEKPQSQGPNFPPQHCSQARQASGCSCLCCQRILTASAMWFTELDERAQPKRASRGQLGLRAGRVAAVCGQCHIR